MAKAESRTHHPPGEHPAAECAYEELAHTSEVGIRVRAATPARLFACAAAGMFALLGVRSGERPVRRELVIESLDAESLLVDWLSELLYLYESTGAVYDQVDVTQWAPTRLEAVATGGAPTGSPLRAIKAVTYHGLRLAEEDSGWLAEVYFDV
jgi:SHS2 domain-containing protein